MAQDIPPPPALGPAELAAIPVAGGTASAGPEGGRDLYLEVFVNGRPMNLITRFTDLGDGVLSADAQELRNSGVLPDGAATSGEVRLDQIPGLGWRLIEPEQTIRFIVPDELLAPHMLDGAGGADGMLDEDGQPVAPQVDHGYGLVLNYGLSFEGYRASGGEIERTNSGSFDARIFMPLGALTHGFLVYQDQGRDYRYRRLDTYWRSAFPGRRMQVQLGDIATRGPGWSRPVRLGGVMVERNFGLRPDLVTLPLPGFEGSAALPSSVEVYSNSIRTYAGEVPEGPFAINDLPFSTGSGVARVVVRDVTGRETVMNLPFLVSDELLRPGTVDFALSAGRPRLGIGSDSDRYAPDVYGVGTLRVGVTNRLTLMAHAEGGKDLTMGGLGATFGVGHWGTASLSFAQSRSDRHGDGRLVDASTQLSLGRTQFSARVTQSSGRFADVASVTADAELVEDELDEFPKHIAQMSFSMPLGPGWGNSASVFWSDASYRGAPDETSFGAAYSQQIWGDSSLTVTAMSLRGEYSDTVVGAQVYVPLGRRRDVSVLAERRDGRLRQYVSASGRSEDRIPGWEWRVQADHGEGANLQGSIARDGTLGRVEVGARLSDKSSSAGLRLDGSVVAAGGGVFLSRRIDDAFAVVDAGAPGVEVMAENRPIGKTGRSGKMLVPDLRAYDANTIAIDPMNLPLDAAVGTTEEIVRPAHHAGAKVDFGVEGSAQEGVIELLNPDGTPLEVGGRVLVNGVDENTLVGFDGEVFALGLQPRNQVAVSYPDGRACTANFDYADEPGTITEIRGVICQ
ncbi:fimbria/pilus outer membrane usher protein [Paracoccus laeviglucosivorans]|nr:fimbria/pilus outer membrane usher protein [Paracoccus laeviglucosivorans]